MTFVCTIFDIHTFKYFVLVCQHFSLYFLLFHFNCEFDYYLCHITVLPEAYITS